EREALRRRVQQVRPNPRHQESVHLRRQPVHHRRSGEPDADHRDSGDPPGGVHRNADEGTDNLKTVTFFWHDADVLLAAAWRSTRRRSDRAAKYGVFSTRLKALRSRYFALRTNRECLRMSIAPSIPHACLEHRASNEERRAKKNAIAARKKRLRRGVRRSKEPAGFNRWRMSQCGHFRSFEQRTEMGP